SDAGGTASNRESGGNRPQRHGDTRTAWTNRRKGASTVVSTFSLETQLATTSLCEAFQRTAQHFGDRPALQNYGEGDALTWAEYAEYVKQIATGLYAVGIRPGNRVALMMLNRVEFHLFDT